MNQAIIMRLLDSAEANIHASKLHGKFFVLYAAGNDGWHGFELWTGKCAMNESAVARLLGHDLRIHGSRLRLQCFQGRFTMDNIVRSFGDEAPYITSAAQSKHGAAAVDKARPTSQGKREEEQAVEGLLMLRRRVAAQLRAS